METPFSSITDTPKDDKPVSVKLDFRQGVKAKPLRDNLPYGLKGLISPDEYKIQIVDPINAILLHLKNNKEKHVCFFSALVFAVFFHDSWLLCYDLDFLYIS